MFDELIDRRIPPDQDAFVTRDLRRLLAGVPVQHVAPSHKRYSDYFGADDVAKLRALDVDVFLRFGFRILRGDILHVARYGVWSFHHGDNRVNRGGPAGFWEVHENWPATGATSCITWAPGHRWRRR